METLVWSLVVLLISAWMFQLAIGYWESHGRKYRYCCKSYAIIQLMQYTNLDEKTAEKIINKAWRKSTKVKAAMYIQEQTGIAFEQVKAVVDVVTFCDWRKSTSEWVNKFPKIKSCLPGYIEP